MSSMIFNELTQKSSEKVPETAPRLSLQFSMRRLISQNQPRKVGLQFKLHKNGILWD